MDKADDERLLEAEVGDPTAFLRLGQSLDRQDREAADQQRPGNDPRVAEHRVNLIAEREAENHRRNEGDDQIADEAPRLKVALEQPGEHIPEGSPVQHDDGEDRPGLDGDVEQRPVIGLEAQ